MNNKVLTFTKSVLPRSNTFVSAQANNLPSFEPIYIGLKRNKTGINLIQNKATSILEDLVSFPTLYRLALDGFQILPKKWLDDLRSQKAKLIHAHFGKGGYYCTPIAKKLELPLITTFHGSDITQKDKLSYNTKHRETVFKNATKIIAVSKFIEDKLLKAGCPEDKIIQHYIGLDNHFFTPSQDKFLQPTILFVGRFIEQKGCQYLLQAMKIINKKMPETKLVIAGYGSYEKKLKEIASSIKNVEFLGPQSREQVKELMAKSWITCLPSIVMERGNEEALAMVGLESLATGTPVVGFQTGGVSESIIHEKNGLLSSAKDIPALAENLLTLLDSDTLRKQMGLSGIEHVDKYFNLKTQCQKLEAIYETIC